MERTPADRRRDLVEQQMAAENNKRELIRRDSNGITVIAYWLMKQNICTIFVHDERTNQSSEFVVPNDRVMDGFYHPYAHGDAFIQSEESQSEI